MSPKGQFILGSGRDPFNIPESQIRYAMENSRSNAEASRFLNLNIQTYKKYAKMFVDSESGKTLWDLHMNRCGAGIARPNSGRTQGKRIDDILDGKYPGYTRKELKRRLLKTGDIPIQCAICGFDEWRIDGKIPLLLDHIDGDITNHKKDNLRWLCYNDFFNTRGNFTGKQAKYWY